MFGEEAAEHRAADTGGDPDAREIGLVLTALTPADDVGNDGLHDRQNTAAATPLQAAPENQDRQARRHRAEHGAGNEQAERGDDGGAASINVAEGAEHRSYGGGSQ